MKKNRITHGRMAALFILGCVLFNYPIFSLFNVNAFYHGVPILLIFIFTSWAGLIFLISLSVRTDSVPPNQSPSPLKMPGLKMPQ